MISPRLLLCSGVTIQEGDSRRNDRKVIELNALGSNPNVNIRLEPVNKRFSSQVSDRLVDLLEIASYVYAADTATRRGTDWSDDYSTEAWERDFHFLIPVRDFDFWEQPEIKRLLEQIVRHLSDDRAIFEFCELVDNRPLQQYLGFGTFDNWEFDHVERITLFSGGLDSLAGAVYAANVGEPLVLVSHSPVSTLLRRQGQLVEALRSKFDTPIIHVPICVNKERQFGRESTQRTRSLLFAALAAVVGSSLHATSIRFFENGVVSLNLPVADEVLRARASRTTHPYTLHLFSELLSLVHDSEYRVENPFLTKTKAEVLAVLRENGGADLIGQTCSCAHTGHFQSGTQWHCGTCSQCIDRRIAIYAERLESFDRPFDYVSDVLLGPRKDGYEKNMAVNYARHAVEMDRMNDVELATRFSRDLSRAVRGFGNQMEVQNELVDLHKRHANTVVRVLSEQIQANSTKLINGEVDPRSMLMSIVGQDHLEPSWVTFSKRVENLLSEGIPIACRTVKPKTEPNLQEICDALLQTHDLELIREFPFIRWSTGSTKPDWSTEALRLWVELKYVRERKDLGPIREAIAADITKYGDANKRVLFVVYDPNNIVTDREGFSAPVVSREQMRISFI